MTGEIAQMLRSLEKEKGEIIQLLLNIAYYLVYLVIIVSTDNFNYNAAVPYCECRLFLAYNIDLTSQLKTSRQQAEVSRQELTEYKDKAARILQVCL